MDRAVVLLRNNIINRPTDGMKYELDHHRSSDATVARCKQRVQNAIKLHPANFVNRVAQLPAAAAVSAVKTGQSLAVANFHCLPLGW